MSSKIRRVKTAFVIAQPVRTIQTSRSWSPASLRAQDDQLMSSWTILFAEYCSTFVIPGFTQTLNYYLPHQLPMPFISVAPASYTNTNEWYLRSRI